MEPPLVKIIKLFIFKVISKATSKEMINQNLFAIFLEFIRYNFTINQTLASYLFEINSFINHLD
jgi:hypothetical protein